MITGTMLEMNGPRASAGLDNKDSATTREPPWLTAQHPTPIYSPSHSTVSSNCLSETSSNRRKMCQTFCSICKVRFSLAVGQCLFGIVDTVLGLYTRIHTPTIHSRDTPYWAGVILLLSGILNLYLCAVDVEPYPSCRRTLPLKVVAVICSTVTVFVCLVAAMFPAILGSRIQFSRACDTEQKSCTCRLMDKDRDIIHTYYDVNDCQNISIKLNTSLILLSILNVVGSFSCLWFVILVWKSRYS